MKARIVLAAGGVRTLSFLGALSELQKNNVEFESISACSAGSLVGACVSSGMKLDGLRSKIRELNLKEYFGRGALGRNLGVWPLRWPFAQFDEPKTPELFKQILGCDLTFERLPIPFSTIAIDLSSAKILVYSRETTPEMFISEAVKVATAIPPLFPAQKRGGRVLVDSVIVSDCPVWLALEYPDEIPIIALKPSKPPLDLEEHSLLTFLKRAFEIAGTSRDLYLTDHMLRVHTINVDCGNVAVDQFDIGPETKDFLFNAGRNAVQADLHQILRMDKNQNELVPRTKDLSIATADDKAEWGANRILLRASSRMSRQVRNRVFISYAHSDGIALRDKVSAALSRLESKSRFAIWDDSQIPPGAVWREAIRDALDGAKVAVLLVTPEFLKSDFIRDYELKTLQNAGDLKLIWLAASKSNWRTSHLEGIQCANDPAHPIDELSESEVDGVLSNVTAQVQIYLNL